MNAAGTIEAADCNAEFSVMDSTQKFQSEITRPWKLVIGTD